MGPLKNTKHEAFTLAVFKGDSGRQAYKAHVSQNITDVAADAAASRLLHSDKVQARLDELKKRAAAKTIITKEMLITRMLDTADDAKDKGVHSAAIRGYELLGRDKGAFQERKTVTVRSLGQLSEEELLDELAGLDAQDEGAAEGRPKGRVSKTGSGKKPPR